MNEVADLLAQLKERDENITTLLSAMRGAAAIMKPVIARDFANGYDAWGPTTCYHDAHGLLRAALDQVDR